MDDKLMSCPGCGGPVRVSSYLSIESSFKSTTYWQVLCKCGWSGPRRTDEQAAIDAWNKRRPVDAGGHNGR